MNFMNVFGIVSIVLNILLIILIIIRSPNEQSLQENLAPFQLFESSTKAEESIDKLIRLLTTLYFVLGIFYSLQKYF